jgi:hypothetical protein
VKKSNVVVSVYVTLYVFIFHTVDKSIILCIPFQVGHGTILSSHLSHLGITKLNIASFTVHTFVTLALVHGIHAVVVHTFNVAASHLSPLSHFKFNLASIIVTVVSSSLVKTKSFHINSQLITVDHVSHFSNTISNIASVDVHTLVTDVDSHEVTVHIVIVDVSPLSHLSHFNHLNTSGFTCDIFNISHVNHTVTSAIIYFVLSFICVI